MPLDLDALLEPIPGDSPCGADIRYHPITDKLKEARRADDDVSQGVWKRERKTADYAQVLKLGREALTKHSKDLQVGAWITEALLNTEGFAGLRLGLDLLRRMLETYWDGVHPQQDEDGDLELRATPLSWVGVQLSGAIREAPLLQGGLNWFHYRDSKAIPTEEQANADPEKLQERQEALEEGGVSPEDFESAFQATSVQQLHALHDELESLMEYVGEFGEFCDAKFGDAAPDLSPLKRTLEEVFQVVRVLYKRKEPEEPAAEAAETPQEGAEFEQEAAPDWGATQLEETVEMRAPVPKRRAAAVGPEPASTDEAVERILAAARYLRREQSMSPIGFLVTRAVRWAEMRATGRYPDMSLFEAPPTATRQELKRLANDSDWPQLSEAAENAAGQPCGRAWLDLQRYAVNACRFSGNDVVAEGIVSELKALLDFFPELPTWTLNDDTPTANAETQQWLRDEQLLQDPNAATSAQPAVEWSAPVIADEPAAGEDGDPRAPDAYDLAMEAARSGRASEAVDILSHEMTQEGHGRGRFLRKTQLAQICLAVGNTAMARPILQDLADEVARRGLEDWESPELISQPLAMLYSCLDGEDPERRKLYARICRLDPARALGLAG